jgi:sigma-54 dependent transcriptional regulator, acetoin dehydrogenase operon transcriptional activator AcoR
VEAVSAPSRSVIAQSWRRVSLSGLDPAAPLGELTIEDFDRRSRLLTAATPVLDSMAAELDGTGYCVILADRSARIVALRYGDAALRPRLETLGAVEGRRFVEDVTGTNSIATTFELRRGVAVHGAEHFLESLKPFSCYGHPVLHPVTKRLEGVLDITCLAEHDNSLLAPFLVQAARRIEERLMAGTRESERRMLAEFQVAQARDRSCPVVALGDDLLLANTAALDLLDPVDHAVLRGLALEASADRVATRTLRLAAGHEVTASFQRVASGAGAIFRLEPLRSTSAAEASRPAAAAPAVSTGSTLIHGEPGCGHTGTLLTLAGDRDVPVMDAADVPVLGEPTWLLRLEALLASAPVVGIEAVHLLPGPVVRRVAASVRQARARVLLTAAPLAELTGELATLVAHCTERIELQPLRHRREEIPALVRTMLDQLNAPRELRFTPGALEALASQPWPGNLRELSAVVASVIRTRGVGDVGVRDLPPGYQVRARSRSLTTLEQAERDAIVAALRATGGNKKAAASRLGISRTTLYQAIRTLGIVVPASAGGA